MDTAYVATVTAHNGSNTASCQLGVTAYDPAGRTALPAPRRLACQPPGPRPPAAAAAPRARRCQYIELQSTAWFAHFAQRQARFSSSAAIPSTGGNATLNATTWSVGAYGSCQGNQSDRPIFKNTGASIYIATSTATGDGRVADIDFESPAALGMPAVSTPGGDRSPYQITLSNLYSNGNNLLLLGPGCPMGTYRERR